MEYFHIPKQPNKWSLTLNNLFCQQAEQSILGSMIIDNDVINEVTSQVTSKEFKLTPHGMIFNSIVELHITGKPVDIVTLTEHLESIKQIDLCGGIAYITDLAKLTPTSANVMAYVQILHDKYRRRTMIELCQKIGNLEVDYDQFVEMVDEIAPRNYIDDARISWGSEGYDSETSYIIDGVMPENSFGVTFGASESFKSFLAIEQACCISTGHKWNGRRTEMGLVVYVAGEGQQGIARRIKAWEDKTGLTSNVAVIGRPINMDDVGAASKMISVIRQVEELRATKVKMVVIDTLARCISGDENSAVDMGAFIKACDKVKNEATVTVNVIHHSGKDGGKGARGSSALRGACDFEYKVTRDFGINELAMRVECSKMKDGARMTPVDFILTEVDLGVTDRYGKPVTSLAVGDGGCAPVLEGKLINIKGDPRWVLKRLTEQSGANPNIKIADHIIRDDFYSYKGNDIKIDTKRKQFKRAILTLVDSGLIEVSADGCLSITS